MKTRSAACLGVFLLLAGVAPARAALITSAAELTAPTVVDFNQFTTRVNGTGPFQVGGTVGENIVFTSTGTLSFIGSTTGYDLGPNGSWQPSKGPFTGSNFGANPGSMTYTFNSGPVSGVGGFVNYDPTVPPLVIEALGAGGVVLESYNINALAPISTPGQVNAGAFRGILRPTADVVAFRVSNGDVVLDDLTFTRVAAIPEPSTLALMGVGAAGLAIYRWRRRV
jgi:hypothetical protein